MAREYGKTYGVIVRAIEYAAKRGQEPYVLWVSPKMARRIQEVADMMGIKGEIKVEHESNPILERK